MGKHSRQQLSITRAILFPYHFYKKSSTKLLRPHLEIHDGIEQLENRVKNVGVEGTLVVCAFGGGPFLGLLVEEVFSPQPEKVIRNYGNRTPIMYDSSFLH